jgi:hypothetical protein
MNIEINFIKNPFIFSLFNINEYTNKTIQIIPVNNEKLFIKIISVCGYETFINFQSQNLVNTAKYIPK